MKIYNYDSITKEFLRESLADESPLEQDVFLIPAFSTPTSPPTTTANEVVIFDEDTKTWSVKADYREANYWLKDDASKVVFSIGDTTDETMTEIEPTLVYPMWDIPSNSWVNNESKQESVRIASISDEANAIILNAYSDLKQKKMMSIMLKYQGKLIGGEKLTAGEEAIYNAILSADAWITAIRVIENDCQVDSNLPVDFTPAGEAPQL